MKFLNSEMMQSTVRRNVELTRKMMRSSVGGDVKLTREMMRGSVGIWKLSLLGR